MVSLTFALTFGLLASSAVSLNPRLVGRYLKAPAPDRGNLTSLTPIDWHQLLQGSYDPYVEELFRNLDLNYTHNAVSLARSSYVSNISCESNSSLIIFFNDKTAYEYIKTAWKVEDEGKEFVVVTPTSGCKASHTSSSYWLVTNVTFPSSASGDYIAKLQVEDLTAPDWAINCNAATENKTYLGLPTAPCSSSFDPLLDSRIGFYDFEKNFTYDLKRFAPGLQSYNESDYTAVGLSQRSSAHNWAKRAPLSPKILAKAIANVTIVNAIANIDNLTLFAQSIQDEAIFVPDRISPDSVLTVVPFAPLPSSQAVPISPTAAAPKPASATPDSPASPSPQRESQPSVAPIQAPPPIPQDEPQSQPAAAPISPPPTVPSPVEPEEQRSPSPATPASPLPSSVEQQSSAPVPAPAPLPESPQAPASSASIASSAVSATSIPLPAPAPSQSFSPPSLEASSAIPSEGNPAAASSTPLSAIVPPSSAANPPSASPPPSIASPSPAPSPIIPPTSTPSALPVASSAISSASSISSTISISTESSTPFSSILSSTLPASSSSSSSISSNDVSSSASNSLSGSISSAISSSPSSTSTSDSSSDNSASVSSSFSSSLTSSSTSSSVSSSPSSSLISSSSLPLSSSISSSSPSDSSSSTGSSSFSSLSSSSSSSSSSSFSLTSSSSSSSSFSSSLSSSSSSSSSSSFSVDTCSYIFSGVSSQYKRCGDGCSTYCGDGGSCNTYCPSTSSTYSSRPSSVSTTAPPSITTTLSSSSSSFSSSTSISSDSCNYIFSDVSSQYRQCGDGCSTYCADGGCQTYCPETSSSSTVTTAPPSTTTTSPPTTTSSFTDTCSYYYSDATSQYRYCNDGCSTYCYEGDRCQTYCSSSTTSSSITTPPSPVPTTPPTTQPPSSTDTCSYYYSDAISQYRYCNDGCSTYCLDGACQTYCSSTSASASVTVSPASTTSCPSTSSPEPTSSYSPVIDYFPSSNDTPSISTSSSSEEPAYTGVRKRQDVASSVANLGRTLGFKQTPIREASQTYGTVGDEQGNVRMANQEVTEQVPWNTWGDSAVTDSLDRFLHYFPDTMDKFGVSRLRVADGQVLPEGSSAIALTPVDVSTTRGSQSKRQNQKAKSVYVPLNTRAQPFYPIMCTFQNSLVSKLYVAKSAKGVQTLQNPRLRKVLTGGRTANCGVVSLESRSVAGLSSQKTRGRQ